MYIKVCLHDVYVVSDMNHEVKPVVTPSAALKCYHLCVYWYCGVFIYVVCGNSFESVLDIFLCYSSEMKCWINAK